MAIKVSSQDRTFDEIDKIAESNAKKLLSDKKTEQVLIYSTGCIGCDIIANCTCEFGDKETYLIWTESEKTFIQSIDCCYISLKKEVNLDEVLNFLNLNSKNIFDSKFQSDYMTVHHSFDKISLITNKRTKTVELFNYYFDSENKYSGENNKQKALRFKNLLIKRIKQIKKDNKTD